MLLFSNSRLEPLGPESPEPPELGLHEVESDVNRIESDRTADFLCYVDYKAFPPVSFITFFRVFLRVLLRTLIGKQALFF